jgi:divalent metal cation (Fe/Co/Zn/Cd) transporter
MSEQHRDKNPAWKVLTLSAVGVGIGFGTCGLGAILSNGSRIISKVFVPLGLVLFSVSLIAFVISVLWLVITFLVDYFRR